MGYYINTPITLGKVEYLKKEYNAIEIPQPNCPALIASVPPGKGLVCVIENAMFDAAGYIYSDEELNRALPTKTDQRKRTWLVFDKTLIENLSGFIRHKDIVEEV